MQETDKIESYEDLKKELLEKIGDLSADNMKLHFRSLIDSDRTCFVIKYVRDLIEVLEERDFLNEDNLSVLDEIFEFCKTDNLLSEEDINDMKEDINFHKKVNNCPEIDRCQMCSKVALYMEELVKLSPSAPEPSPVDLNSNYHPTAPMNHFFGNNSRTTELDAVIDYISENIGKDWRPFASFLGVREKIIQDLYNKYNKQNKIRAAAYEALLAWKERLSRKTDDEKKYILIQLLQRKNVFYLAPIADDIINGEHLKPHSVKI